MKTSTIVVGFAVALAIGVAAGYALGLRRGLDGAYKRTVDDQLSNELGSWMREARTCLSILYALDSAKAEDSSAVRRHGLITLRSYVSSVEDMRRRDPSWRPQPELEVYTNAAMYLAAHPQTQVSHARP
jgi:hypothetical protein